MTKEKFDELREAIARSGKTVVVALGEMGIPKWRYYRWKQKYYGNTRLTKRPKLVPVMVNKPQSEIAPVREGISMVMPDGTSVYFSPGMSSAAMSYLMWKGGGNVQS